MSRETRCQAWCCRAQAVVPVLALALISTGGAARAGQPEPSPARHAAEHLGTIEGVVTFSGDVPRCKVPDDQGEYRPLIEVDRKTRGLRYVLVCLPVTAGADEPAEKTPGDQPEPIVMDQFEHTFVPPLVAIRTGQRIAFTNSDVVNHNVQARSLEPANQFNVYTNLAQRYEHQFVAEKQNRYIMLTCNLHPWMRGWVFVFDHPFYAVTDAQGTYRITGVRPGKQQLVFRQPDVGVIIERSVDVAAGQAVRVDLNITPENFRLR